MSNSGFSVGILGVGSSLPEKRITNFDLEKMVDTSDEWITKRTGISERRILEPDAPAYALGVDAARKAIKNAGISPEDIGMIITTTSTPDYLTPSTSCMIQGELGAVNAAAFDMNAACTGFVYAMTVAEQFISSGCYKYVLIVSCEAMSKVTDWKDRNTCVLFGDGAGAVLFGPVRKGYGITKSVIGADGTLGHYITIPCCYTSENDRAVRKGDSRHVIWMDGSEVFKFAVKVMTQAAERILDLTGLSINDIKLVIPHQANIRIIDGALKRLGASHEKFFVNLNKYGNISSASIPVALDEAVSGGLVSEGDNLMMIGFGGGMTWGATLIKWGN